MLCLAGSGIADLLGERGRGREGNAKMRNGGPSRTRRQDRPTPDRVHKQGVFVHSQRCRSEVAPQRVRCLSGKGLCPPDGSCQQTVAPPTWGAKAVCVLEGPAEASGLLLFPSGFWIGAVVVVAGGGTCSVGAGGRMGTCHLASEASTATPCCISAVGMSRKRCVCVVTQCRHR